MMKNVLAAAFLTAAAGAWAQDSTTVLIESCNLLPDPGKRLECLKAAVSRQQTAAPLGEAVTRAFVGLQGALDSGVSYRTYQALLIDVARELAVFKRSASEWQKPAIAKLEKALETYNDAGTFWERSIEFYARRDNNIAFAGGLPVQVLGLGWLVSKHHLPTRNADLLGFNVGVPVDAARAQMWMEAKLDAEEGLVMLADKEAPTTPAGGR